jgi:hypothetical protein
MGRVEGLAEAAGEVLGGGGDLQLLPFWFNPEDPV